MNDLAAHDRTGGPPPARQARRSGRTGRRPGASGTREDILKAARAVFAEHGYSRAKMRDIAREARVNSALIHHFYGSKERLFLAAVKDVYRPGGVLDGIDLRGPVDEFGVRLLRGYLEVWRAPETRRSMLAVIRSAASHGEAADLMAGFVRENVARPMALSLHVPDPGRRAALIGSQLVGIAVVRYVVRAEPLASLDLEKVVQLYGPTIQRYLTGDLSGLSGEPVPLGGG